MVFINRSKLVALCGLIFFSCIQNVSCSDLNNISEKTVVSPVRTVLVPNVNQVKIDTHKKNITSMITFEWRIKCLMLLSAVGGAGYIFHQTFGVPILGSFCKKWIGIFLKKFGYVKQNNLSLQDITFIKKKFEIYDQELKSKVTSMADFLWWKQLGGAFLMSLTSSCILNAAMDYKNKVYHDNSIAWFAENKTQLGLLRQLLTGYAARLNSKDPLSEQDCTHLKVMISTVSKQLVGQTELIAAFIDYQLDQFQNRGAYIEGDEILQIARLKAMANQFADNINALLKGGDIKSAEQLKKPLGMALQLVVDLGQQIKRFTTIELCIEARLMEDFDTSVVAAGS